MTIQVFNEIGKLKRVLLHRPGPEILNLVPEKLEELLFDDIPGYYEAMAEHDQFAEIFSANGVEVVYLTDLVEEAISDEEVRLAFVDQFVKEANISTSLKDMVKEYLLGLEIKELVATSMAGILAKHIDNVDSSDLEDRDYIIPPLPNLYFTRDCIASIGNKMAINSMYSDTRSRESIYMHYVGKFHPDFKDVDKVYSRDLENPIEGGDIIVVNEKTLLIGSSQRTSLSGIKELARKLSSYEDNTFETILIFHIAKKRSFMHLDTVLTQLDENSFLIHPEILENLRVSKLSVYSLESEDLVDKDFEQIMKDCLGLDKVNVFLCGNNDPIAAKREQWTDGSNVVALDNGVVIAYKRNFVTNKMLRDAGFTVYELDSSNLTMGRGGPRCMTMPLWRDNE